MFVPGEGREQIANQPARAGVDFNSDSHAGRQRTELVLDLHLHLIARPGMILSRRIVYGNVEVGQGLDCPRECLPRCGRDRRRR